MSRSALIKNISSLGFLQISNYLFPLITLPYLVRVLGPEKYGLYNFVIAFLTYFNVLIDYGFNFTATRQVSIYKNDKDKLSVIAANVLAIKVVLSAVSFAALVILFLTVPKIGHYYTAYLLGFLMVIGNAFYPFWLYQGIEDTKILVVINFIIKALFAASIFIFILNENDYQLLLALNGGSLILISFFSLAYLLINKMVSIKMPDAASMKTLLKEGKDVFISNLGINIYTSSNIVVLGFLTNDAVVGIFSAADKIRLAVQAAYTPVSQSLYPRFADLFKNSVTEAKALLKRVSRYIFIAQAVVLAAVIIFSEYIVSILLGADFLAAVPILRTLAFLPLIVSVSNLSGILVMLNIGEERRFKNIVLTAAFINVALLFILVPVFGALGAAYSMLTVEVFVSISMTAFINKKSFYLLVDGYV